MKVSNSHGDNGENVVRNDDDIGRPQDIVDIENVSLDNNESPRPSKDCDQRPISKRKQNPSSCQNEDENAKRTLVDTERDKSSTQSSIIPQLKTGDAIELATKYGKWIVTDT